MSLGDFRKIDFSKNRRKSISICYQISDDFFSLPSWPEALKNEPQFQAARLFGHRTQGCSLSSPSPHGATPLKLVLPPCADGMLPSSSCGPTCWEIATALSDDLPLLLCLFLSFSSVSVPSFSVFFLPPFPLLSFSLSRVVVPCWGLAPEIISK